MITTTLQDLLLRTRDLPAFPGVVAALIRVIGSDSSPARAVVEHVGRDAALAARALRLANSSFYGRRETVGSIERAVAVLGFNTVRSLAVAASTAGWMASVSTSADERDRVWRHSIRVALFAQHLARESGLDTTIAFAAGLLHDVGRLASAVAYPEQSAKIGRMAGSIHGCGCQTERAILGFDHAQAGASLARAWRLPPPLVDAIARHHDEDADASVTLGQVVRVADSLAHRLDSDAPAQEGAPFIGEAPRTRLGLDDQALQELMSGVRRAVDEISENLACHE